MGKKIGRNDPCHCGSGKKYKYCHYGSDKPRIVKTDLICDNCDNRMDIDFTKSFVNKLQPSSMPLMMFCKENGFYMFGAMSLYHIVKITEKLENNTLTKGDFYSAYKEFFTRDQCIDVVAKYCENIDQFKKRQSIIFDTIEAHFNNKYTLSVPVLFLLVEGILRELLGTSTKDNIQPRFDKNIWDIRLLFDTGDRVEFLNSYINSLFEGGKIPEVFNRNTVLHGLNNDYDIEENSWSLLLLLVEIGSMKMLEKNTAPFTIQRSAKGILVTPPNIPK